MTTARERAHIAAVNAGEAYSVRQAERLADLELSPLSDALKAVLVMAQGVLEGRVASEDERRLAEKLIDLHGDPEDIFTIRDIVAE